MPNDLTLFVNANVSTYGAGADADENLLATCKLQNIFTSENFVWPNEHTVSFIGVYG